MLTTGQAGDGALEGSYKVVIHKIYKTGGISPEEYEKNYDAITSGKMKVSDEVTHNDVPVAYGSKETTSLSVDVKGGQSNNFKFDISAK